MAPATDQDHVSVTVHSVERLTVRLGLPYAEAIARFEKAVPAAPLAEFRDAENWDAVKALLEAMPFGFAFYGKIDSFAMLKPAGVTRPSVEYLAGNHTIAETMFRRDPAVVVYAPLRLSFFADDDGDGVLAFDRPSDLFGSFGDEQLTEIGLLLDGKLVGILGDIGVAAPASLVHAAS